METFLSFVPGLVAERFLENPSVPVDAQEQQVSGAVLFADISGFTSLTERLSEHGAVGAEQLTQILNTYFGRLIDVISASGGDILKFAGDALLAVWGSGDAGDSAAVLRAAHCALAAQSVLREFKLAPQNPLSLRIGIGVGSARVLHVGGEAGRW